VGDTPYDKTRDLRERRMEGVLTYHLRKLLLVF
jgi:hypothetical protein